MKKIINLILLFSIITTSASFAANSGNSKIKTTQKPRIKATSKPIKGEIAKISVVDAPADDYQPGDPIRFKVNCPNVKGKVQYRVVYYNMGVYAELYLKNEGYYSTPVSGKTINTIFVRTHPLDFKGSNFIVVYAKAYKSKKSYDSYEKFSFRLECH